MDFATPEHLQTAVPRPPAADAQSLYDIRHLKTALNRLGYYTPDPKAGITGDVDDGLKDALYAYQRKNGVALLDTGLDEGGTTARLLQEDLAATEDNGTYIWRTVGDEKVRGHHASRNGKIFSWDDAPEGGHPAEDYNCRCWAEPVNPPYHPWIEWVNQQQDNRKILQGSYVQANAGALVFGGTVISVEMCLRNGRCRTWLMQQVAKAAILASSHHLPPKELPAYPDAKWAKTKNGRKRWVDSQGKIYEWDYQHGEVEVYDKTGKKHLGGFDPKTGKQRSNADRKKRAGR